MFESYHHLLYFLFAHAKFEGFFPLNVKYFLISQEKRVYYISYLNEQSRCVRIVMKVIDTYPTAPNALLRVLAACEAFLIYD